MNDIVADALAEKAQQIARLVESGRLTQEQGHEIMAEAAAAATSTSTPTPRPGSTSTLPEGKPYLKPTAEGGWYNSPTRNDVALAAAELQRGGASEAEAWRLAALGTHGLDQAQLDAAHQANVARAERQAFEAFAKSPEGIAALGAQRRRQAAADAELAANYRPELEARGVPVADASDAEVLEMVSSLTRPNLDDDVEANRAAAEAPIPAQWGEGGAA